MIRLALACSLLSIFTVLSAGCPGSAEGEGEGDAGEGEGEGGAGEGEGEGGAGEGEGEGGAGEGEGEGEGGAGEGEGEGGAGEGEGEGGAGEGEGEGEGGAAVEICDDLFDNDGDQTIDCADTDCAASPLCVPGVGVTGAPCSAASDCAASALGQPLCLTDSIGFPGGICSANCDPNAANSCPGDGVCIPFFTAGTGATCLDVCTIDADCGTGYHCGDLGTAQGQGPIGTNTCIPDASCGDSIIQFPEGCDGTNIPFTCQQFGFATGQLDCTACQLGIGTCADLCGDGIIGQSEQCEGSNLGGTTCESFGLITDSTHALSCDATNCGFDTSTCLTPVCGDGLVQGNEQCDGTDLQGQSCTGLGFAQGTLACDPFFCGFDTSGCSDVCGDNIVGPSEQCDTNNFLGRTCQDFGFAVGNLACDPLGCFTDTTGCSDVCGDGLVGPTEQCDTGPITDAGCNASCQIEACLAPLPIGVGTAIPGDTTGGGTQLTSFCTFATGVGSTAFEFVNASPNPGTLTVTLNSPTGQSVDLRSDCTQNFFGNCGTSASTNLAGGGTESIIVLADAPGQEGPFTLDVSFVEQVCGDGIVSSPAEQCDPPDGITCDANCQRIVPPQWTCDPGFFGDGLCDCGCGFLDPDCANATDINLCQFCDDTGSCSVGPGCPGTISPTDTSVCQ